LIKLYRRLIFLFALLTATIYADAGTRTYVYPSAISSFTGALNYCTNRAAQPLTLIFTTTTCTVSAVTGTTHINDTITWYSNTSNSTSGGTVLERVVVNSNTTTFIYVPLTNAVGTLYYYAKVSWATQGCVTAGSLTTTTQAVTINSCTASRDMPNPPANLVTVPAGSYVIPMDNEHQNLYRGFPFNIKAYGLVDSLLLDDIPVYWVIKSGKIKDSSDFSASASRVYPTAVAATTLFFHASEFIIDTTWLNKPYYSGEKTALQIISGFAKRWKVAVYKLTSNTTVDIRYTLHQRPKLALFDNGTYQQVAQKLLDSAKCGNYTLESAGAFTGLAQCYTFCTEMHWAGATFTDSSTMLPVWQFIQEGGNFLGQCAGQNTYENFMSQINHFHTTKGTTNSATTNPLAVNYYTNPDMAFSQFEGSVVPRSGTTPDWTLAANSEFDTETYNCMYSSTRDTIVASARHFGNPDSVGGNVFYLGGHDYMTTGGSAASEKMDSLRYINGTRMFLNAILVPANRPTATPLNPGSNTTICSGDSATLGGSPTAPPGATYSWSPSGAGSGLSSATASNPKASPSATTTYTCVAFEGGCQYGPNTVTVTVNTKPSTPTPSSNSPICANATLTLSTAAVAGATYSWSGPNGFSSTNQNPSIVNAQTNAAGTYSLTVTVSGCTSPLGTTAVTVNPTPSTPSPSSNSPVCSGTTLNLSTGAVAGATYSWTGPSAFSSTNQNPSISNVAAANAGTYSVTVTAGGCTSPIGTTSVTVNATPATPSPTNNSPICVGSTLDLNTSAVAGATYSWSGPSGFTSTNQNPTIAGATAAASGTYSLTVTVSSCPSAAGVTTATVSPIPSTPAPSSNSPVCVGSTLNLSVGAVAGATYSWTGPSAFSSSLQNPSISGVAAANAGTYSLTVTVGGCPSAAGTTSVTVNPTPATPSPSSNSPVCAGSTLNLSVGAVAGATYSWTGPNSFSSSLQNPSISNVAAINAGTYSLTVTVSSCPSAAGTTSVTVNPTPATPSPSSNSPICAGSTLSLSVGAVAGATYSWTGPNSFSSSLQNPNIVAATTAATGTYSLTVTVSGCTSAAGTTAATVNPIPSTPSPSSNSPVCAGSTLNLSVGAVAGATYSWTGPSAFSSSLQNPSISNVAAANAGTYSLTVTVSGCTSAAGTTSVTVNPTPATPSPSSNSPICAGSTLSLSVGAVAGATYSWTGPNSFSSSLQNPNIVAATTAATGTYSLTVTVSGCTSAAGTTAATVNPIPATPSPSSNSPICAGSTLSLSVGAVAGATYSWTGPNSFSSSLQNPNIVAATTAATGTYSLTVTVSGCTSAAGTTAATVNPIPATPSPSSNSPVCAGSTLNLSVGAVAGATYSWTGPSAFSSSLQNPSISNVAAANAGTYSLTVTVSGCTSAAGTTSVTVNPTPATPSPSSNSPICAGSTLNLSVGAVAGATYSWTGPNSFSSSLQNPNIAAATTAATGTYSLTVTVSGCTSAAGTTAATVNPIPATPSPTSNSPICAGSTLSLSVSAVAGATYSWTGPNTFSSSLQNPNIVAATTAATGTYSLTVTVSGCTSAAGTTAATVNPIPATPSPSSNSPVCVGAAINLSQGAVAGATYSWSGPSGFTSTNQNPSIASAVLADGGTYSVTVTVSGCTSAAGTTAVTVNPIPSTPSPSSNTPVCVGSAINLSVGAVAGATYSWTGPNSFSSALQNPSIASAVLADAGTYSLTVTVSGCTSATGTTAVTVNPIPGTPSPSSNTPVCVGSAINLSVGAVAGATYSWTGPNSFSSSLQNPSIASAVLADAGTYSLTVTVSGCGSAAGTTAVTVNPTPATPSPSSNSPVCVGSAINLSVGAVAGATYSWTGPNSFSSALQNPSIASAVVADAGTYSLTVTVSGCTSATGTTAVAVNTIPATPSPSSNTPVCQGSTLSLSVGAVAGATYSWTGPNAFSSSLQNPTRAAMIAADAGTYSLTVTVSGCTSATGTTDVTVTPTPATPSPSSNSPVCVGSAINLSVGAVAGATYSWTGPNSFSSSLQNPSIASAVVADAGTYSLTVTVSSCTSAAGTTAVVVNTIPATPSPTSNSPVCQGSTLNLSQGAVAGATYSWTGPNSFSSSLQNPSIASVVLADAGTYSVTVTVSGCTSAAGTTAVTIGSTPATPSPSSNSPVCVGSAINLSTGAVAGATYSWTGPNSFSSSLQTPSIASAVLADGGTYSVTVTVSGCTSAVGTTAVTVNPIPSTPSPTSNSPVCVGNNLNLSVGAVAGATYSWTGPNSFNSALQNPSIVGATTVATGTYSLTVTVGGCTSAAGTTAATVNPPPTAPAPGSNSPVCQGYALNLTMAFMTGATYSWSGPSGFTSTNQNPTIASVVPANAGTYSVTVNVPGCGSAGPGTTSVTVNPTPATPVANNDGPVCEGATLDFSTGAVAGATYSWTGPNSFSSTNQNPSISNVVAADAGTYSVTVTVSGCTSAAGTTTPTINPTPATPSPTSNSPQCVGSTLNLSTAAVGGATYSWNGPSGFSSSLRTPSIAGATSANAGTYSVTVTAGGCTSAVGTTTVVITALPATPSASSNSPICANDTLKLSTPTLAGAFYTWTGPNSFSSTAQNPDIPLATLAAAGTYSVVVDYGGCPSAAGTTSVTINPAPATPGANNNGPICEGSTLSLTTPAVGGATYSWTGPSSFSSSLQNPTISGANATNAGTYSVTITVAGCPSLPGTTAAVVNDSAVVSAGSNQTVCANNDTIQLSGSSSTLAGTWTTSGSGTFKPNNTTLNGKYIPSNADTTAGSVVLTLTSNNNGACLPVKSAMTVTFTHAPTSNAGPDQTVCANNANVTLNGSVTVASGGKWISRGTGTFTPNNTALNATYNSSAADTTAGKVWIILETTGNGLCKQVMDSMKITYTHAPLVNPGANQTVCANNPDVSLNGSSSTGTGQWSTSGTGTFTPNNTTLNATYNPTPADTVAGTVTLTLTSTGNGTCNAVSKSMTVTIIHSPAANAGSDQTVCANNDTVQLSGTSTTGHGQWSSGGTGAFSPNNTTLNAKYIPSSADTTAGSVTLTLTTTNNGGCFAVSSHMQITFTHAPTSNAGPDQTVCANNANVTLNGSVTIASGGKWISRGTGTFTPNNTTLNATYNSSAADTTAGSVWLILKTTGNGLCKQVLDSMKVTYTHAPLVNPGSNQTVCANNPDVSLNGSSSTGTGQWSTSGTGTFTPNNTTLNGTYIPSPADTVAGTVTLTLTSTGNGTCNAVNNSMVVTIIHSPTDNAGSDQTVCANNDTVQLSGTSTTGHGQWSTAGSGTFLPNNITLNARYVPSSADTTAGSVTLTLTTTNNGGCFAVSSHMQITFTHAPTADAGPDQTACANNGDIALNGSFAISTGAIWLTTGSGTFSPSNTSMSATYTPSNADTTTHNIFIILKTTGNGQCKAVRDTMKLTYTSAPLVEAGRDTNICLNNPNYQLSGYSSTTAGTWTTSGTGTFSPNSNTLNATYMPSTADTTAKTVTLILTSGANGSCLAVTDTVKLTYSDVPDVNAGSNQTVCANNDDVSLNATSTTGTGVWSTSGSGTFAPNSTTLNATYIPSNADTAAGTVTLTFSSTGGCTVVSQSIVITITHAPVVNAGPDQFICKNSPINSSLNGQVTGGASTGQWSTSGSGTFSPNNTTLNATYIPSTADTSLGSVTLVLTSTNNGNCIAVTDTMIIKYTSPPVAQAGSDLTGCTDNSVPLSGNIIGGSGTGIWTTPNGTGTFVPDNTALSGAYIPSNGDTLTVHVVLTLTSTNNGGCLASSDSIMLTVVPGPEVNAGPDQHICKNNLNVVLSGSINHANGGAWTTTGTGTFTPNNTTLNATYIPSAADTAADSVSLALTSTGNGVCQAVTDSVKVIFTPSPVVSAGSTIFLCTGATSASLNGSVSGGSTKGRWTTAGSGTFSPNDSTLNATYNLSNADTAAKTVKLTLTSIDNTNCFAVADTVVININPIPVVNAGNDTTLCSNNDILLLNGKVTGGSGTGVWSTLGSGTFTPKDTALNATYTPSAADIAANSVKLVLAATNSCQPESDTMVLNFTPAPIIGGIGNQAICGGQNVSLNAVISVATGGKWTTTGDGIFTPNDSALNATYIPGTTDTASGSVTLILKSTGNGNCFAVTDSVVVAIQSRPTANFFVNNKACINSAVTFRDTSTSRVAITNWAWNFGGGNLAAVKDTSHIFTTSGYQPVALAVTTSAGCSDTLIRTIFINPLPTAMWNYSKYCSDSAQFEDMSTVSPGGIQSWLWKFGDSTSGIIQNAAHTYHASGTYSVNLVVTSDSGCSSSYADTISVYDCTKTANKPAVPSAFTPNGDGTNDILYVEGGPFTQMDFRVFDEWGTQIFRSTSQSVGWDGKYGGKPQAEGGYKWTLVGTTVTGETIRMAGNVTILR
jgi:gliding motility-associated-like protein